MTGIAAFLGVCLVILFFVAVIFRDSLITNLTVLSMYVIIPVGLGLLLFG